MVFGGSGGCEPRIKVVVKRKSRGNRGDGGRTGGGSGGCEPRIEFIVKLKKWGGVGWI